MSKLYHSAPTGKKLRVLKPVRAHTEQAELVKGRGTVRSYKTVTLTPGEIVEYISHDYGPGSDPAFEVTLRREDRSLVAVIVGWFDLRKEDFELLDKGETAQLAGALASSPDLGHHPATKKGKKGKKA